MLYEYVIKRKKKGGQKVLSTAMHAEPELANLQSITALTATNVLLE
jgi:hypothetical protein